MKTKLLFTFILFLGLINLKAQNPSDGCTGVPTLTVNGSCITNNYTMAGSYANGGLVNASCTANNDRDDGWYQFVATATSTTVEATGDLRLALSVWTTCGGGTELGCNQVNGTTATVTATTTIGITYFIQLHRRSGNQNTGTITGTVCVYSPVPTCFDGIQNQGETGIDCGGPCAACPVAGAGDDCTNAIDLAAQTSPLSSTTVGATIDFSFCTMGTAPDLIFYYDLPHNSTITIQQTSNGYDSKHSLRYSGACPGTIEIACTDDPDTQIETFANCTGSTQRIYWIQSGYLANTGVFTLAWAITAAGCPTCFDGIQNQGETGIDCGGPCVAVCPPATCSDGIQNQGETGVDCGGPCPACAVIIPTSCGTQTFNITGNSTFYDDGGAGGLPCSDPHANNFASSNCETTTTICAPAGQTILASFNSFAMFNTSSAYDWMRIYEGTGTGGTIIFDNNIGGAQHNGGYGDCGDEDLSVLQGLCSNGSNCLTFEFHASGVVDREGWDASISITNGTNCALPITLISFEGKASTDNNLLKWSTSSEINNDYFILEKSEDGIEFSALTHINGAGNSNNILNYFYNHKYPQSVTYYRLKQIDFDGNFSYSKTIVLNSGTNPEINFYPNPSKGDLFFDLKESHDGQFTITYVSVLGRTIKETINISTETKKYKASTFNNLSSGVYFVQIINENNEVIKSQKIIKE